MNYRFDTFKLTIGLPDTPLPHVKVDLIRETDEGTFVLYRVDPRYADWLYPQIWLDARTLMKSPIYVEPDRQGVEWNPTSSLFEAYVRFPWRRVTLT